jgi:copper oxidase (laccase) domain-containing protein
VAACHAGWRGVAGQILNAAILRLEQQGCPAQRLLVALGPAIDGVDYQVEQPVVDAIASTLGTDGRGLLEAQGAISPDPDPGRWRLDIRSAATLQLQQLGVSADRISRCPLSTAQNAQLFLSWRRDQRKAVQWSGIVSQA